MNKYFFLLGMYMCIGYFSSTPAQVNDSNSYSAYKQSLNKTTSINNSSKNIHNSNTQINNVHGKQAVTLTGDYLSFQAKDDGHIFYISGHVSLTMPAAHITCDSVHITTVPHASNLSVDAINHIQATGNVQIITNNQYICHAQEVEIQPHTSTAILRKNVHISYPGVGNVSGEEAVVNYKNMSFEIKKPTQDAHPVSVEINSDLFTGINQEDTQQQDDKQHIDQKIQTQEIENNKKSISLNYKSNVQNYTHSIDNKPKTVHYIYNKQKYATNISNMCIHSAHVPILYRCSDRPMPTVPIKKKGYFAQANTTTIKYIHSKQYTHSYIYTHRDIRA